ncbi:hypothetical protein RRG08_018385 [Elysia crispata]|uniref:Uncharacterized protein n=1 Tax=Elysia crispata TaxID=231223 RepID=A0AAE1D141_9GAST|nr:hypothetical protein RRG08_018385 [Elysia crispata]
MEKRVRTQPSFAQPSNRKLIWWDCCPIRVTIYVNYPADNDGKLRINFEVNRDLLASSVTKISITRARKSGSKTRSGRLGCELSQDKCRNERVEKKHRRRFEEIKRIFKLINALGVETFHNMRSILARFLEMPEFLRSTSQSDVFRSSDQRMIGDRSG